MCYYRTCWTWGSSGRLASKLTWPLAISTTDWPWRSHVGWSSICTADMWFGNNIFFFVPTRIHNQFFISARRKALHRLFMATSIRTKLQGLTGLSTGSSCTDSYAMHSDDDDGFERSTFERHAEMPAFKSWQVIKLTAWCSWYWNCGVTAVETYVQRPQRLASTDLSTLCISCTVRREGSCP